MALWDLVIATKSPNAQKFLCLRMQGGRHFVFRVLCIGPIAATPTERIAFWACYYVFLIENQWVLMSRSLNACVDYN